MALVHGQGPLTAANGFADQGEVVVKARQASDLLGATKMDRPEWLAIDPNSGWVYCTLTNNSSRGGKGQPGVDAANPRANNTMGHIIRWKDDRRLRRRDLPVEPLRAVPATRPTSAPRPRATSRATSSPAPTALRSTRAACCGSRPTWAPLRCTRARWSSFGNNQMLACDLATGETRRFLTGPADCEITGVAFTPDGTTMFLNIQHPGETPSERSDPAEPAKFSNWPDYRPVAGRVRPRWWCARRTAA